MRKASKIIKIKGKRNWGIIPHNCSRDSYQEKSSSGDFKEAGEKTGL
ncbi:MAG: hypothetical protein JSV46_01615 [Candidatus Aminicenantes bacterium]|nr:MAG: hypothetical protein JSV46_01615 [Candidatus Aminicenantes bacterium]